VGSRWNQGDLDLILNGLVKCEIGVGIRRQFPQTTNGTCQGCDECTEALTLTPYTSRPASQVAGRINKLIALAVNITEYD